MSGMPPRPPTLLPRFLRPITLPASRVYGMAVAARNRRYDRGNGVRSIGKPVISVGNITTGGTGKSPMVAWIARFLDSHDVKPVIAMRGYKSRPGQSGDEEAEYRLTAPDVPVVAHPDRVAALRAFLPRNPDVSCVVLDDGFQHRCVHRDLDIVLIDATRDTFHDQLLPAGHLREPFDALQRADAVIVTRAGEVDAGLAQEIDRWHGKLPIAWTRHAWTALRDHLAGGQALPVSWLKGKRVVTMLGVGNPKAIIAQLEDGGANVMADVPVGDHEDYDIAELALARGLCGGLDAMVVTRKDWVKIEPLLGRIDRWPTRIIVPQLEMEFLAGQQVLSEMLLNVVRGQARGNDRGIDRAAR